MEKYNCLIVEDEPLAAEILQDYVSQVPFLNLVAVCPDAVYALSVLQKKKIDLIFLDLHLPKLKGFDFIKTLAQPPKIIITTAYHQYALQGYEFNVLDYLMKPIAFARFLTAVNKLKPTDEPIPVKIPHAQTERGSIFFNVGKKKVKVYLDEILYIESVKEYVNIVTTTKSVTVKFQLGQLKDLLPRQDFIRIHRSFVVGRNKIDAFSASDVEIGKKQIPIGRSYKELVLSVIQK